jgi:hypothetical protein
VRDHFQHPDRSSWVSFPNGFDRIGDGSSHHIRQLRRLDPKLVKRRIALTLSILPRIPSRGHKIKTFSDLLMIQKVTMKLAEFDAPHDIVLVDEETTDLLHETFRIDMALALNGNFQSKILEMLDEHEAQEQLPIVRAGTDAESSGATGSVQDEGNGNSAIDGGSPWYPALTGPHD